MEHKELTAKNKTSPIKKKMGRPIGSTIVDWSNKDLQNLAMNAYASGLSIEEMCALCGTDKNSFYRWLNRNPDFSIRLDQARAYRKMHALTNSHQRAFPDNLEQKADSQLAQFLLRTVHGCRDEKTIIQIANVTADARPKDLGKMLTRMQDMSDEELMRIAGAKASLPPGDE